MKNYLDWNKKILKESWKKVDLNFLLIVIIDILYFASIIGMVILWDKRIKAAQGTIPSREELPSLGLAKLEILNAQAQQFLYVLIFSIILLIIAVIFVTSILKGIIWAKTTKTKLSFKLISKFLLLNLMWMPIWIALLFLITHFIQDQSKVNFTLVVVVVGTYFTVILYSIFMKNQKYSSIKKAFLFKWQYITQFIILIILLSILMRILNFTGSFAELIKSIAFLVYTAFARYYFSTLVYNVEKIK